jgi:hypothetical protein
MSRTNTKLTTVNVIDSTYKNFKEKINGHKVNEDKRF